MPTRARRQARDRLLVRGPITILSRGSYLLSLVFSFSFNIADLSFQKEWRLDQVARCVSHASER